jgi:hypothetical protein
MCLVVGSLIAGAVAGGSAHRVPWRPLLKRSLKQGIKATRSLQSLGADVRDQAKRLVDEVRVELDNSEQREQSSSQ